MFSETINAHDPGPTTLGSTHVLQTQRLDTAFIDNSLVSFSKPVCKKREVKIGISEIFKEVGKPPPRIHIHFGRKSMQLDMDTGREN